MFSANVGIIIIPENVITIREEFTTGNIFIQPGLSNEINVIIVLTDRQEYMVCFSSQPSYILVFTSYKTISECRTGK